MFVLCFQLPPGLVHLVPQFHFILLLCGCLHSVSRFWGRKCGSECQVSATWQWIPYHMLLGCTNESPSRSKVRVFIDISCYFPDASISWSYMNFLGLALWVLSISHNISQFFWGSGCGKFSFSIWEEKHQQRSSNHEARIVARHCKQTYIVCVHTQYMIHVDVFVKSCYIISC